MMAQLCLPEPSPCPSPLDQGDTGWGGAEEMSITQPRGQEGARIELASSQQPENHPHLQ